MKRLTGLLLVFTVLVTGQVFASQVEIVHTRFEKGSAGSWHVNTTLKHEDSGWSHYADAWRVVDVNGKVLGTRTLFHPHEDEQPFTRGHTIQIPVGTTIVYVEAHDKVHGWSKQRVRVDLTKNKGDRFEVH